MRDLDVYRSVSAAAQDLGVSLPTLLRELAAGRVPARRIGRRWILSRRALAEWLGAGQHPADDQVPDGPARPVSP